jgi:hypothetical protein
MNDKTCRFKPRDRTGLYIMVFIAMMNSCDDASVSNVRRVERKVDALLILHGAEVVTNSVGGVELP